MKYFATMLAALGLAYSACQFKSISPALPSAPAANDISATTAAEVDATTAGEHEAVSTPAVVSSSQSNTNLSQVSTSPVFRTTEEEMLAENNRIRAQYGAPAQKLDERLCKAAQDHADYLARTNRLEHSGANGSPLDRAHRYGFSGIVNENVAGDFSTIANAFGGWYGSTVGHRETLLSTYYDLCGFGYARGPTGGRWVALYGREGSPPPGPQVNPWSLQAAPQQQTVYRTYSSCGPNGCGPIQQRRAILPWRR